jgi:hypothetical protein
MKRERKFISNAARISGIIETIDEKEKATIISVKTDDNVVNAIAFSHAKQFTKDLKPGDFVVFDATIQSNNSYSGFPSLTIAVNHVSFNTGRNSKPRATFSIAGRPLSVNKMSATRATALIITRSGSKINTMRVYYESTEENIERFCSLGSNNFLLLHGSFTGQDNSLYVNNWRHIPSKSKS